MGPERSAKPIHSSRADDPDLEERIDAFVVHLGERVDELQDVEAGGDRAALRRRVLEFGTEALELGYEPLADAAQRVAAACEEAAPETVRKSVEDLTAVAYRVRRGHRSFA